MSEARNERCSEKSFSVRFKMTTNAAIMLFYPTFWYAGIICTSYFDWCHIEEFTATGTMPFYTDLQMLQGSIKILRMW